MGVFMRGTWWAAAAFLLLACARPADAKTSFDQPAPIQQGSVRLPDQLELGALILLTADVLEFTLEFDPALLRPSGGQPAFINFRGERSLDKEELWLFTNQVLSTRGLALVRPPGSKVVSLVRSEAAAGLAGVRMEGESGERTGFISEMVRIKNRSPKDIQELIGKLGLKPPTAVTPIGESGLLLVSEYSTKIEDLKRMIERFDVARDQVRIAPVPAKNLAAAALATAVTALANKRDTIEGSKLKGEVSVAPDGRSLLIVAPEASHPRWMELISLLDQQEPLATVEYSPRSFSPKEVSDLIEKTEREAAGSGSRDGAPADRLRLTVNDLTGSLIVTASPSQQERIRGLINRLEASPTGAARPLRAFAIRNRPAADVMRTLSSLVQGGALEASEVANATKTLGPGDPRRQAEAQTSVQRTPASSSILPVVIPSPGAASAGETATPSSFGNRAGRDNLLPQTGQPGASGAGLIAPNVSVSLDTGTNSILVMAEPRVLAQMERLIRLIDVRQPQVMLEMTLVSLSEQDAMNLGIELEKVGVFDGASYQMSSLFGLAGGASGNRAVGDSRGLTSAVLNPGDFSVVLRALQTISRGSTKSIPQFLVSNNESAAFKSVLEQPYLVSNTTSGAGTTTSFGGTQDAGTIVTVTPQIAEADQLLLQYSIALSSFVGAPPSNGLPPARQQNTVSSKATIPDGYTVVVGGIELQSEGKNTSQVPGVGDVPILGELFKQRDNSAGRSRFFVFIRATVLRDQQLNDLKFLSSRSGRAAGVQDGFPDMSPRIVR